MKVHISYLPCTTNNLNGKFAAGVNDTHGKFAAGVNDTGGNLLTPAAICHRYQRHQRQIMGTISGC